MTCAPCFPYKNACGLIAQGVGDLNYGLWGKITDIEPHGVLNGEVYISYTIDTLGQDPDLFAVMLLEDGVYSTKSKTGEIVYRPDRSRSNPEIELYLFPDEEGWEGFSGGGNYIDKDQVRLRWTYSGDNLKQVNVLHNAGASVNTALAPKKAFWKSIPTVETAESPLSGGKLYASGKWKDQKNKVAEIEVEITTAGAPDTAQFKFTLGEYTSAAMTVRTYPQMIGNGIRVWFEAGVSYQVGDNWTIGIDLEKEYLTRPLADGQHSLAVQAVAHSGETQISNTVQKTINSFPTGPSIESYCYLGSGSVEVSFDIPNEADIVEANFYKNRPDLDDGFVHWGPIAGLGQTATPNTTLGPVTIEGLVEGKNRIVCRLTDSDGQEEQNVDWLELVLDASLLEVTIPNAPFSIKGEEIAGDEMRVTVYADSTSDEIEIYMGELDSIDYGTVIATIANPGAGKYQALTKDINWAAYGAGEFMIAARAKKGTYVETNTDIWNRCVMKLVAPPWPILSGEVV